MNTLGKISIGVVIAIAVLYVIGLSQPTSSQPTPQAEQNTLRNNAKVEFVQGCTKEGGEANRAFCECGFDAISSLYSHAWYTDQSIIDRLLKDGYNYNETEAVKAQCGKLYVNATNES